MIRNMLRSAYRRFWVVPKTQRTYKDLSIAETFQRIYSTKSWGDQGMPFSSGAGSRGPVAERYSGFVIQFIRDYQVQSMVDLGCGDYAVGSRIVAATGVRYTGIDVVPDLIEHHRRTVTDARVQFQQADISSDPLPPADLCLVRQVLQHLSNDEIRKVLANLRGYSYVLISEDVPVRPRSFNRDKPHGPDIRGYAGSGVWVDRPPFSVPVTKAWEFPLSDSSLLRTVLIAGTPSPDEERKPNPTPATSRTDG